ncbi:uncharacterized protein LOC127381464 [Apus apus]|uniref:uncharacterized protein LOC127381464 n=1 Tax=Apus apus TaxID=8895 RepID=UPI0021F85195|nr:uncharacterized protein LOC127381464 [Apus apus]
MMMMRMKMRMVMGIPMLLLLPRLLFSSPPPSPPPPRIAGLSRRRPAQPVRRRDTEPARPLPPPRPHTAPARSSRPAPGADTGPAGADLTGWRPRRAAGKARSGATGRDGTRCHGAPRTPTPHRGDRPTRWLPPPSLFFIYFMFPVEKENQTEPPSGMKAAASLRGAPYPRPRTSAAAGAALAPPEPRGAGAGLAAARGCRDPLPPPRVCGSGRG